MRLMRVMASLFVIGGAVRVVANQAVFAAFGIGGLWVGDPYFLYIYKVLGAFVILVGIVLWSLTGALAGSPGCAHAVKWGMIVIGAVMLGTGIWIELAPKYYMTDVVFSWLVAVLLHRWKPHPASAGNRSSRGGGD